MHVWAAKELLRELILNFKREVERKITRHKLKHSNNDGTAKRTKKNTTRIAKWKIYWKGHNKIELRATATNNNPKQERTMMAALVSTIDDWIRNYLFLEKAIIDDRMENPLTTISIPNTGLVHLIASSSLFSNNNTDDDKLLAFEIYAPNMTAWYQMGFVRKHTQN